MEEVNWSVEERFIFPTVGLAKESELIKVTPQWQLEYDAESVRLVGVYHITAHLEFEEAYVSTHDMDSVVIDDVDFDGVTGYFEYALPFTVDMPENIVAPSLTVHDIRTIFDKDTCAIAWDVSCHYSVLQPVSAPTDTTTEAQDEELYAFQQEEEALLEIEDSPTLAQHAIATSTNSQDSFNQLEQVEVLDEVDLVQKETLTSAPMIWDLQDHYITQTISLNPVVRE